MNLLENKQIEGLTKRMLIKKGQLIDPMKFVQLFILGPFKNAFVKGSYLHLYNEDKGIYERFDEKSLVRYFGLLFITYNLNQTVSRAYLMNLTWFVFTLLRDESRKPDQNYITFVNGHYNLNTGKIEPFSPKIISFSRIDIMFRPNREPVEFLKLLSTNFKPDAISFIRSAMYRALKGRSKAQVFVYFLGPGGTGKSLMINLFSMIVGENGTVTTTLRDLHNDKFETANLIDKRLIVINDTEGYKQDLQVLKAITGNDSLVGRIKHESGNFEVRTDGFVVISGNQPLLTKDNSGALSRRVRVVPMNYKPPKIKDLLFKTGGSWDGVLHEEADGIIQWIGGVNSNFDDILTDLTLSPSLLEANTQATELMNPLITWVKQELKPSETGSYLGFTTKTTPEALLHDVRQMRTLYPCYLLYAKRTGIKPLGHVSFSRSLIATTLQLGIDVTKSHKRHGSYLSGLEIRPEILQMDYQLGAPMALTVTDTALKDSSESLSTQEELKINGTPNFLNFTKEIPYQEEIYQDYYKALGKTDLKVSLNKAGKLLNYDPKALVEDHIGLLSSLKHLDLGTKGRPSITKAFKAQLEDTYLKGIYKITNGLISYNYKPLGLSPRILPVNYGHSFNSVKKVLREKAYSDVVPKGMVILDMDLKSCYTSILLGLFPLELFQVTKAIEAGLWKQFEKEFKDSGRAGLFNKPAVKICTYSSFFGGGPNAMIQGCLEFMRKELGMRPVEFRKSKFYEPCHALARDVSEFMNKTDIIKDFRKISKHVKLTYDNQIIYGPTGHGYEVNDHLFQSSYPNFLQSYEFYLLAKATINTLKAFPKAELIGHFHDGNVVILPAEQEERFLLQINENLNVIKDKLGLQYPQIIEHKVFYQK
jgi:phage/plasmid-associated DNA primase